MSLSAPDSEAPEAQAQRANVCGDSVSQQREQVELLPAQPVKLLPVSRLTIEQVELLPVQPVKLLPVEWLEQAQ